MKYLSFLLVSMLFVISCDEDYAKKELPFSDIDFDKVIVLNGEINSKEDTVYLSASTNASLVESENVKLLDDINITFKVDDDPIQVQPYKDEKRKYNNFVVDLKGIDKKGKKFTIEADYKELPDVSAEVEFPSDFKVQRGVVTENGYSGATSVFDLEQTKSNLYEIDLQSDNTGVKYFRFSNKLIISDTTIIDGEEHISKSEYWGYLYSVDRIGDQVGRDIYIKTEAVGNIKFKFYDDFYVNGNQKYEHYMLIDAISESEYLYQRSFGIYTGSVGLFVFEPITIYSNVKGGLGLFSSVNSKTIKLDKK